MFTVDEIIQTRYPRLEQKGLVYALGKIGLRWLLQEDAVTEFARQYPHLHGIEFIEQVLDYFNFSFAVSSRDRDNIPSHGRVMIVANHPIGSLDGLSLLRLIHEVRPDVKVLANDMLMHIEPMRQYLLPVNNMGGRTGRRNLVNIFSSLEQEQAVIVFPSGEVSRLNPAGVRDGKWNTGFLKMATRTQTPILPVHISGHNSPWFYGLSMLCKPLSTALLVREMFGQQNKKITFRIGGLVPHSSYTSLGIRHKTRARLFKKHIYRIGKGRKGLFRSQTAIALPERRCDLKKALEGAERLGTTPDNKVIYLYDYWESSPIMREIGRLREIAFRAVGEGSGCRRDLDRYDPFYRHLILWDEDDLEIAGAYRLADAGKVVEQSGIDGLYTGTLFQYDQENGWFLKNGLELGRSFVQPKYWGRRSLDYLWFGIGTFLARNPQYRYLFGPVSISNAMPILARELLVFFYSLYFGASENTVTSKNPVRFDHSHDDLAKEFCGDDYRRDFKQLKQLLANMGVAVPPLYKQYSELCTPGGVQFLDFNVDPDFGSCIDGLVVVDLAKLKEKKRRRYMGATTSGLVLGA